jgi:archaellum biogenesis ATPase FlaH
MYEIIRRKLENLPKNAIILAIIPHQHYQDINLFLLRYWMDIAKSTGAYVSLNRPYKNLIETLNSGKIEHKRLFFVDCVTKNEVDVPNCYFLKTQQSLTNLSIAISTVLKTEKPEFVFVDSLNTLALYNEMDAAIKFAHFLVTKLRTNNVDGIILAIQDEKNREIITDLSQICDKIIDLTDTTFFV